MADRQSGWTTFKAWVAEGAKDLHNNIVPAFPAYAHGVDEPGTPQNNRAEPERASFADRLAQLPETPASGPQAERSLEP